MNEVAVEQMSFAQKIHANNRQQTQIAEGKNALAMFNLEALNANIEKYALSNQRKAAGSNPAGQS